ncbi:helix-turn-helix domain-containing protein [Actinomadura kijaniata]|uniref:helix-turn-helix domain-containing protein n=1 Tax=Actinomadura kijaniata TaxID=46161 RepID=UPI003F1BBBFA
MFANAPAKMEQQVRRELRRRWRVALRLVMVLLSLQGLSATQIAGLLEVDTCTARRWIIRFNDQGITGLVNRPHSDVPGWADHA